MNELEVVHPVAVEEVSRWRLPAAVALLHESAEDERLHLAERRQRNWDPQRAWGVRDRGDWVGSLGTFDLTVSLPGGGTLPMDGVTSVTVAATHRRRGLLRRMITESLAEAAERGDPLSGLVAAEWPIYGRYGYAPASDGATYRLRTRRSGPLLPPPEGRLRTVNDEQLRAIAPQVHERSRRLRAGEIARDDAWWDRDLGTDGFPGLAAGNTWVVHEDDHGVADGVLGWKRTRDFHLFGPLGGIEVSEMLTASDAAYRDLWCYLAGVDAVEDIALDARAPDEPVRWLLHDARALERTGTWDYLWLRLLDVPAALAGRGYEAPGDVVIDVVDDGPGGFAAGRVRLAADAGGAECATTTAAPDVRLEQRALAACYLGAHRLGRVAIAGHVEELTPGALARLDAMLATSTLPFTQTGF